MPQPDFNSKISSLTSFIAVLEAKLLAAEEKIKLKQAIIESVWRERDMALDELARLRWFEQENYELKKLVHKVEEPSWNSPS